MPIINDVEVEGCKYFLNNEHKTCGEGLVDCESKDCLYKQLKRLEQKYNEVLNLAKQNADSNEYCLQELEKENENLREAMHKDFCPHYVLGECSQEHHNNCVGRNQCIKELEKENEELKQVIEYQNVTIIIGNKCYSLHDLHILFSDACFNGLTAEQIIDSAKKYLELLDRVCELEKENEKLKNLTKELEHTSVVYFAKISELEKALEEIREIVLENPWEETDNWIKGKILEFLESEGE